MNLRRRPRVNASRAIVDSEVDELIVKIAIEDDDVGVPSVLTFAIVNFMPDGIDEAENHAHGDSETGFEYFCLCD